MYVMLNNFWLCMCLLGMGAHRQPENLITASTVFDVALAIINYACMSDLATFFEAICKVDVIVQGVWKRFSQ